MNQISFYNELYKQLCDNEILNKPSCLISSEPLEKNHITLSCGHSYNYNSIFTEVKQQKYLKVHTEIQKLKKSEVKCPYCRKVQNGLLPYNNDFPKIAYVNHPYRLQYKPNKCMYTFKYGKRKGMRCLKSCHIDYCHTCDCKIKKKSLHTHTNINNIIICSSILKSGKRKGLACGRNVKEGKHYCGIHTTK